MNSWDGTAAAYRRSFGTLCAGTIPRLLAETDGEVPIRHLDVGCGTGELAAAAAAQGRRVTAVDADASMVASTDQLVGGTLGPRSTVLQAALPDLPVADASVDAVTANFVINHLDRPLEAMREVARTLRAGGVAAMTIWPAGGPGWGPMVSAVFQEAGAVPLPSNGLPEHVDFPRTPAGLADLAAAAGFLVRSQEELTWQWTVDPEDLWAGIEGGIATPGATYLAQSAAVRRHIDEAFRAETSRAAGPDSMLQFDNRAVLVVVEKP